jgi:glycosyltransferase involved in cell wall biosynthesis
MGIAVEMNQKRHRILYIEEPKGIGGSVIGLYELIRGIDLSRYEPIVLFHEPTHPYCQKFREMGIKVLTLGEGKFASRPGFNKVGVVADSKSSNKLNRILRSASIVAHVTRMLKAEAIDLVHHNDNLPKNRETVLAAALAGVPQVCHIRTLAKFSPLEGHLTRFVNTFIYMSTAIEKVYRDLGVPANQGQVIYDGFESKSFDEISPDTVAKIRAEFNLTDQDWLISNIGRIDYWKGHEYFLQAIAKIAQTQRNVKALIVGEPLSTPQGQAYYEGLKQLAVDLQLSDTVIFTGYRADIPQIMAASDILVHSASEPEPFGRVVVEGMLAGRAVIATAAGGVLDIIKDQETGLLISPKDADAMAKAIQQLLQDRKQSAAMGQRAQQKAREVFSVKQHVASVQYIYERILSK